MTLPSKPWFVSLIVSGFLLGAWATKPTDRITGATVVLSDCGLVAITTTHSNGELRDYPEYPGDDFVRTLQEMPREALVLIPIPCPISQFPQYEANKNEENSAEGARSEAARQNASRVSAAP